jgi:5'-3' exonuclease
MGIPTYFSHIVKKHRKIIKKISEIKSIDNLYLDANSIIYDAVHALEYNENNKTKYETSIIIAVCKKIDYYIETIKPKKKVFIAFDGVAPFAKIKQQQKRRYLNWFNQQLMNSLQKDGEPLQKWNTASITPGTLFMQALSAKLLIYFGKNNTYTNLDIIVSTANEPGEGEHKIYEYIRENADYHKNTTTLIYGLDADLIMLTLTHLHISNKIYLYRETPHFIQTIDKTLDPNQSYLIDIPLFAERIVKELSIKDTNISLVNKLDQNKLDQNKLDQNKLHDYIFMCFLLGNDFLPHFPSLNIRTNGIEKLITAYLQLFSNDKIGLINNDKNIVWKNVRKLIDYLAQHEEDYIQAEYKIRNKQEKNIQTNQKEDLENKLLTLPLKDRAVEYFINPFDVGWESRYYNALFDIENILPEREKEFCVNYLEGLEWTFAYYTTGCLDWHWMYKYSYPPLLKDLKKYVPHFEVNFIKKCKKNPISIAEQLNYVLPEEMKKDLIATSEIIKLDEKKNKIKWAFCKYLWEAHLE